MIGALARCHVLPFPVQGHYQDAIQMFSLTSGRFSLRNIIFRYFVGRKHYSGQSREARKWNPRFLPQMLKTEAQVSMHYAPERGHRNL